MYKRMNRSLGLALCLSLAAAMSVAACKQTSSNPHGLQLASTAPTGEMLYVLEGATSAAGGQRIVAVHLDDPAAASFTLPVGLVTQDHQKLYVATPHGTRTTIATLDTRTGATLRTFSIAGQYATDAYGYGGATLTPDGHWLALRQVGLSSSTIALVDTQAAKVAHTIQLSGDFALDALSPDGSVLYLLQNLHDAQHHYYVRAYDVGVGALVDQIIVDKSELDNPQMQGSAVARRIGDGGAASFTLYVDPGRATAFVHALPLNPTGNITPFARCVDNLPASASADLLRGYTLALSPDGTTLYAVNAALGVVSKISIAGVVLNANVVATGRFEPMGSVSGAYEPEGVLSNGAALSADGATLYVAGAHGLQVIRTSDMQPLHLYLSGHPLTGVAPSANGKTLYVTDAHLGVLALSAEGSRWAPLGLNGAQAPIGIAWVDQ